MPEERTPSIGCAAARKFGSVATELPVTLMQSPNLPWS